MITYPDARCLPLALKLLGARTRLFTFEPLVLEHEGVGIGNGIANYRLYDRLCSSEPGY